ncbi:hsp70-binding protein 1 [Megalopta genalis]|uniref:hsp70-binding protein 1 n=1 Tax=Megalopta genalis TaxID=115081 RepID=UPI0014435C3F|nr:hsp70-binding protein 1 [Megalopta genalis]XP_033326532.1 hsp70-binding protein 1 [Megalopta genalis]XP_033326533.1 hsp70-binding protein 1 [Megalopta genalis]
MGAAHATKVIGKMERSHRSGADGKVEAQSNASSSSRPLSIQGPQSTNNAESHNPALVPNQPRQPRNLQGLLRYAMEATNTEDSTNSTQLNPMDAERQQFLTEALSSLSCNVIEELQKSIKILSNVVELCPDDDTSQQEVALERIADYVDNVDIANDFYKIGGFSIFGPCLNSPHNNIRWRAADVIAELTQNNPFCQNKFLETGLFPVLLKIIDTDPVEIVRIKALYAVSCIVREHSASLKYMDKYDGYSVLLRAMQSPVKKLQIKSAFLLCSLCYKENTNNLKLSLINMGFIEQATGLLVRNELIPDIRDQLLNILDGLTNNNFLPALNECKRPELCLQTTLGRCIKELQQEESLDQLDVCYRILKKVFPEDDAGQER